MGLNYPLTPFHTHKHVRPPAFPSTFPRDTTTTFVKMSRAAVAPCRKGNYCWYYHTYLQNNGKGDTKCRFPHAPPCREHLHCIGRPADQGGSGACTFFHYTPGAPATPRPTGERQVICPSAPVRAAGGAGAAMPLPGVALSEHWGDADLEERPESARKALHAELEAAAAPAPAIPADMAHALGKLQEVIDAAVAERVAAHVPAPQAGVFIPDLMNFGVNPTLKEALERLFAAGVAAGAAAAAGAPVPPATAAVEIATDKIVDALIHTFGDDEDEDEE